METQKKESALRAERASLVKPGPGADKAAPSQRAVANDLGQGQSPGQRTMAGGLPGGESDQGMTDPEQESLGPIATDSEDQAKAGDKTGEHPGDKAGDKERATPKATEEASSGRPGNVKMNNARRLRMERMMSKAELARRAGVSTLTIDRVERGLSCRMDTKRKIIEALGLKPADRSMVFAEDD